jgi:hypothetical protein
VPACRFTKSSLMAKQSPVEHWLIVVS